MSGRSRLVRGAHLATERGAYTKQIGSDPVPCREERARRVVGYRGDRDEAGRAWTRPKLGCAKDLATEGKGGNLLTALGHLLASRRRLVRRDVRTSAGGRKRHERTTFLDRRHAGSSL